MHISPHFVFSSGVAFVPLSWVGAVGASVVTGYTDSVCPEVAFILV
jgi:hypothetical protein